MFTDSLGMLLRSAYLSFHRRANAHFDAFGLTADQFVLLTLVAEDEGTTQRDLCGRAASDANTIGEMVSRLEKKKLLRRERHPGDGRARCVFLTPAGRQVQQKMWKSWEAQLRSIDEALRPTGLKRLKKLLSLVPDAVRESDAKRAVS